jgi:N-sulfoglucosamine sulfohydrolase
MVHGDFKYLELAFGKRPSEESFDMDSDPDCVKNLTDDPEYAQTKKQMWAQLESELIAQGDPRVLGKGDIFDFYPYIDVKRQQELYNKPDYDPVQMFNNKYGKKQ